MTYIVRVAWPDRERKMTNYPAVLNGMVRKFSGPAIEFLFVDEHELQHLTGNLPFGREPSVQLLGTHPADVKDAWSAATRVY